jgi:hypothetical protein
MVVSLALLMMGAKSTRNMYSSPVWNKIKTAKCCISLETDLYSISDARNYERETSSPFNMIVLPKKVFCSYVAYIKSGRIWRFLF